MPEHRSPAISIIVPLFNKAAHIGRCLASVRAQQVTDYEVIVVDDGSTDDGPEIAGSLLRRDDRLIRQSNAGAAAARNRGLAAMRGRLAAFLDADDEWYPTHLACLLETAQRFPHAGLLSTGFGCAWLAGLMLSCHVDSPAPRVIDDYFDACLAGLGPINSSSCAVRREAVTVVGGLVVGKHRGEDLEFFARLALHAPVALHPAVTAVYHMIAENRSDKVHQHAEGFPVTVDTLAQRLREGTIPPARRAAVRAYLCHCIIVSLTHALLSDDAECAREGLASPLIAEFGLERQAARLRIQTRLPLPLLRGLNRLYSLRRLFRPNYVSHGICISVQRGGYGYAAPASAQPVADGAQ